MAISIKIKGLEETKQLMEKIKEEKTQKIADAIKIAGFYIQAEVQESIAGNRAEQRSVDTGRFLNSVKTEHQSLLASTVYTNVSYAEYLEYGTSKIEPRRHFTNTAKRNELKVKESIQKAMK